MANITLENIGRILRRRRGNRGVREVSKEIKISSATLSRVERGGYPDINTFRRICEWLQVDPGKVLGIRKENEEKSLLFAHLKADRVLDRKTATALGGLIIAAQGIFGEGGNIA